MKAKIDVELRPFAVPNFVLVEKGNAASGTVPPEAGSFSIKMIDAETLDRMCSDFRNSVFTLAGKQQPPMCAPVCARCDRVLA